MGPLALGPIAEGRTFESRACSDCYECAEEGHPYLKPCPYDDPGRMRLPPGDQLNGTKVACKDHYVIYFARYVSPVGSKSGPLLGDGHRRLKARRPSESTRVLLLSSHVRSLSCRLAAYTGPP